VGVTSSRSARGAGAEFPRIGDALEAHEGVATTGTLYLRGPPALPVPARQKLGETKGQDSHAFGAGRYVLSPAAKKIEKE
jgi:hypothetical protein